MLSFFDRRIVFALLAGACYGQQMESGHMFDTDIPGVSIAGVIPGPNNSAVYAPNRLTAGSFTAQQIIDASNHPVQQDEFDSFDARTSVSSGTISAQTLAKPPSKKALKYLNQAERYSHHGNSAKAIEVLRNAPMDPAGAPYLHSRLGTEYLKAGQFTLAAPELEEAARLLPREPVHHSNLAYLYRALGQYDRAEKEARLALTLDDSSAKAHFLLGFILIERGSGIEEAVTNLKLARKEVRSARFLLAQVYLYTGHRDAAQREMEDYLSVATEAQRVAAEQWFRRHSSQP